MDKENLSNIPETEQTDKKKKPKKKRTPKEEEELLSAYYKVIEINTNEYYLNISLIHIFYK